MSANPESFLSEKAKVDEKAIESFPNSKKIYIQGSCAIVAKSVLRSKPSSSE